MLATIFLCLLGYASASNILVVLPLPAYSHTMPFMPLFKTLASRGHNLTIVSAFPQKEPVPNIHDIEMKNIRNSFLKFAKDDGVFDMTKKKSLYFELIGYFFIFSMLEKLALQDETVQSVIKDTSSNYDLIMTETHFSCEAFTALGHKYNAPVINLQSGGIIGALAYWTGNHFPTAYVPNLFFPYNDQMTFWQRSFNSFIYGWEIALDYFYFHRERDDMMRKYMVYEGSENLPPLDTLLRNTSLTLTDSHLSLRYPIPLHSNIIEVSGMGLKTPEALPADLQKIMDDSKDGVILFSLGSNFDISILTQSVQTAILRAVSKVKQTVIMKLGNYEMLNKPPHVHFRKWLPQPSILAHKNCRLFISHGGIHGVTEGIYHGVPILGLPLMADQSYNIKKVETTGMGIGLDIYSLTEPDFSNMINELLNNPRYEANAEKRSAIMRDRPMSSLDTAVYWVEYVIRHNGAPHLRPVVLDMPVHQYFLLDVIAFFCAIFLAVCMSIYLIFLFLIKIFKYLFCKQMKKLKKC